MSYTNNLDIRSFEAASAIGGHRIAAAADATGKIRQAVAGEGLGIAERVGCNANEIGDVIVSGRYDVLCGGDLDFDDPVTSDADGRAVKAVAVAGQTVSVIGYMAREATLGDIAPIQIARSLIVTPA